MQKNIQKVKYYNCGYCINNLKWIFKKQKSEKKKFAAGVFLIEHKEKGYVLFDTGYSSDIYKLGIKGKLYNTLNPTFVKDEDLIVNQLKIDNIDVKEIKYLILSHLHPDHIGGVKYFENAKIIVSEESIRTYKRNNSKDLIFKKLLPNWFEKNLEIISDDNLEENENKYFKYYDLFKDGSIKLTKINGHASGQMCALLDEKVFLGADSSWGNSFVGKVDEFRIFPKLIQSNMSDYIKGDKILQNLKKDKIQLCFSHDDYENEVIYE